MVIKSLNLTIELKTCPNQVVEFVERFQFEDGKKFQYTWQGPRDDFITKFELLHDLSAKRLKRFINSLQSEDTTCGLVRTESNGVYSEGFHQGQHPKADEPYGKG